MKTKKILYLVLVLIVLQLARIAFKKIAFLLVSHTLMTDVIVNVIFMILAAVVGLVACKKRGEKLKIFPEKFSISYIIATVLAAIFVITTPIFTKTTSLYDILFLIYGAIVTVIYEELIFRGYIFSKIEEIMDSKFAYIISTVLFGIWHLGYVDTVLWRTSMFNPNADILNIMIWKAITGMVIGVALGFLRYKKKNTYVSMLLHTLINTFGS